MTIAADTFSAQFVRLEDDEIHGVAFSLWLGDG
jgi:hypothetical protein